MIQIVDMATCTGCGACAAICPKQCITMKTDRLGFAYPSVNQSICVDCGLCEQTCPIRNRTDKPTDIKKAYAIKAKDDSLRMNSSSGGVFSLLANSILEMGGVVYGAAFDSALNVYHRKIENGTSLFLLQGSKYIQSKIDHVYEDIEDQLKKGVLVLFTGTPCQINGLKMYLGLDYDNLITQDLVCHGVSSPAFFNRYCHQKEFEHHAKIQQLYFRDKTTGWKDFSVRIVFEDGTITKTPTYEEYMKAYLKNYALRPSCYYCQFKGKNRMSDITLADFWGVEKMLPEMYDEKGVSAVICHSEKGYHHLQRILPSTIYQETTYEYIVRFNSAAESSVMCPPNNDEFCNEVLVNNCITIINKYCKESLLTKTKRIVKKSLLKR